MAEHLWLVCLLGLAASLSSLFAEEVRVATYNLDNYLVMDRQVDARWRPGYPKPETEKAIVRQVIRDHAPEVLVLQEIGSVDFLEELQADLAHEGLHYGHAVHMKGEDPTRHLAVLSTLAPKNVEKHQDLDFKYLGGRKIVKRGMLEMAFQLGEEAEFQIFAVHLKSRFTENKEDPESRLRRVREAEACRDRIIERTVEQGKRHYLIVGDFNDSPDSATFRRFYQRGAVEIGSLVPASDSQGELWTYFYKKGTTYSLVDGMIASSTMLPFIKNGSGTIIDQPSVLNGSDHRMVYIDLLLPGKEPESLD